MSRLTWNKGIEKVEPHLVKILTPSGTGTGFLCFYNEAKTLCGIATAAHVVDKANYWKEPIRIRNYKNSNELFLKEDDRIIFSNRKLDTAVVIIKNVGIELPSNTISIISEGRHRKVGDDIGWVGFPSVSPENLCFFNGRVSYWSENNRAYLVDGVAINGVSGGPAFYTTAKGIIVVGSVSAYLPNVVGSTPGLSMITDVQHYLQVIKEIKDFEEAKKKAPTPAEIIDKPEKGTEKTNI